MFDLSKIFHSLYSAKEKSLQVLGDIFDFWHIRIYLAVALVLNILEWAFVFFIKSRADTGSLLILHYNVNFGVDLIGEPSRLIIVPLLGLVIIAINSFLAFLFVYSNNFRFLSHLFLFVAMATNIFLLVSLVPIYLINFR